jgi:hypothetical protein
MSLTKDEIIAMAREAGGSQLMRLEGEYVDNFQLTGNRQIERFATLCRAPLVAENERLKESLESVLSQLKERDAEIARVRAGEPVAHIAWKNDKPCYEGDDAICEDAVWPVDSDDYRTSMPVFTAPQPAAQEPDCATTGVCVRSGLYASPPSAVPVVEQLVEALDGLFSGDVVVWSLGGSARPRAAITAGQKFIKENGK